MTRMLPSADGLRLISDKGWFTLGGPLGHMVKKTPGGEAGAAHHESYRDNRGRHPESTGDPPEEGNPSHRGGHGAERVEGQDAAEHVGRCHFLEDTPSDRREDS